MQINKKLTIEVCKLVLVNFCLFLGLAIGIYFFFHGLVCFIFWDLLPIGWWIVRIFLMMGLVPAIYRSVEESYHLYKDYLHMKEEMEKELKKSIQS